MRYGVFDGVDGFIGLREKFGDTYLFTEYHWETGAPFGTTRPLLDLGPIESSLECKEGDRSLFKYLERIESERNYALDAYEGTGERRYLETALMDASWDAERDWYANNQEEFQAFNDAKKALLFGLEFQWGPQYISVTDSNKTRSKRSWDKEQLDEYWDSVSALKKRYIGPLFKERGLLTLGEIEKLPTGELIERVRNLAR